MNYSYWTSCDRIGLSPQHGSSFTDDCTYELSTLSFGSLALRACTSVPLDCCLVCKANYSAPAASNISTVAECPLAFALLSGEQPFQA